MIWHSIDREVADQCYKTFPKMIRLIPLKKNWKNHMADNGRKIHVKIKGENPRVEMKSLCEREREREKREP